MRHLNVAIWLVLLSQLVSGCASNHNYVSFSIGRAEFRETAHTLAVLPVTAPAGFSYEDSSLAAMDKWIEDVLLGAGYSCIPAREYQELWDRVVEQMGGLYDADSGEFDELKYEVALEQVRRDVVDLHHPDFLLIPEVWIVTAESSGGVAKWDGTSQAVVGWGTRVLNAIDAVLGQYEGFLTDGIVDALSLGIVVEDTDGREIMRHSGGIEVLKRLDETKAEMGMEPFEPVLGDGRRNQRAVTVALYPRVELREGDADQGYSSSLSLSKRTR